MTKLTLKSTKLKDVDLFNLKQISQFLKELDLRHCSYSFDLKKELEYYQHEQANLTVKMSVVEYEDKISNRFSLLKPLAYQIV